MADERKIETLYNCSFFICHKILQLTLVNKSLKTNGNYLEESLQVVILLNKKC